ncbi:MAG: hypothetical protein NTV22_11385 [bacterium]|nr:hypothetical protein [bacterium]
MKWKLARIDWHRHGNCWTWRRVTTSTYYRGNQRVVQWGRVALVFERGNMQFLRE